APEAVDVLDPLGLLAVEVVETTGVAENQKTNS
ncbi:hypothetical protein A2U01_0065324, partial [Trifolium medium]|nr:hypothetical protein [Trifolium medium]